MKEFKLKTAKTGDILSFSGLGLQLLGAGLALDNSEDNKTNTYIGGAFTLLGMIVSEIGHKKQAEFETEQAVMRALINAGIYEEV